MLELDKILMVAIKNNVSDVHLTTGTYPVFRINGKLKRLVGEILDNEATSTYAEQILGEEKIKELKITGEMDTAYSQECNGKEFRFRVNIFLQRGQVGIVMRLIADEVPSMAELGLPEEIFKELCFRKSGLILVTGPTGSGKSTTLASMIDYINSNRDEHIVTIEDPIEYVHRHKKSIVNQREIGADTGSFANALRGSLREDPDIILVGEMRDKETINAALTAAETGHLVFSTLHTVGAAKTIDRIVDTFESAQQQQVKTQLSTSLQAVISQRLVPNIARGRSVALEIMIATPAIRNLVRDGKMHQIQNSMQMGDSLGMCTMDSSLVKLYEKGDISSELLEQYAMDLDYIRKTVLQKGGMEVGE